MNNLPGSTYPVSPGAECEYCGDHAVVRMQGETDSFGAEYHDLCQKCYLASKQAPSGPSWCDFCKGDAPKTTPYRDFEEGSNGPVYHLCDSHLSAARAYDRKACEEAAS